MRTYSVGTFLLEKLGNMALWAEDEIGKENMPADIVCLVESLGSIEVTYLATILHENHTSLVHRDWTTVVKLLTDEPRVPEELVSVIHAIRSREQMHDKFWRYLCLFSETVAN